MRISKQCPEQIRGSNISLQNITQIFLFRRHLNFSIPKFNLANFHICTVLATSRKFNYSIGQRGHLPQML